MRSIAVQHLNKLLCLMLCATLLGLLCNGAWALNEHRCQLIIDYHHEDIAVSEAAFHLYRIANLTNYQELSYTDGFSDLNLDMDGLRHAAEELYTRVEEHNIQPEQILITDSQGKAMVTDLAPGAFLLVCEPTAVGDYVYYADLQVIFLYEETLTMYPKSTRLPVGEQLISIQAVKVWDDRGHEKERPRQITVRLLKDGKTVETATLSEANGWSHTWNDLLPNARWTVKEEVPKGYVVSVEQSENLFTLTNQYKDIPQTGQIWWPVITVMCMGLLLIVIGLAVRRSGRHDA